MNTAQRTLGALSALACLSLLHCGTDVGNPDEEGNNFAANNAANNADNNNTGNNTSNNTGNNNVGNNANNNVGNNANNNVGNNNVEPVYLFVLIEDLSDPVAGNFPGFDGDGATLTKAEGGEYHVSAVDDFNIASGEMAINPEAFTGPPDDECQANPEKFVSLGGVGGYLIVSFATADFDGRIQNGDTLTIHEIGRTSCPDSTYDDDPYRTSVALTLLDAQSGNFRELGQAQGEATLPVSGL